jgi:hypothetical protein
MSACIEQWLAQRTSHCSIIVMVLVMVLKVFSNARDAKHQNDRDRQVPKYAPGGVALSSSLDAIHDLPNNQEPMPYVDRGPELLPNGQDASTHWPSVQEPTHILQQPVAVQWPIGHRPIHRESPLEGQ